MSRERDNRRLNSRIRKYRKEYGWFIPVRWSRGGVAR